MNLYPLPSSRLPALFLFTFLIAACRPTSPPTPPLPPSIPPATVAPTGQECTLIGCADALIVELKGNVPAEYDLEATAPDGTTLQVHCADGQGAGAGVFCQAPNLVVFQSFTPEEVLVTITWEGGTLMQDLKPIYTTARPNGPNCEPECRQGVVELYVP